VKKTWLLLAVWVALPVFGESSWRTKATALFQQGAEFEKAGDLPQARKKYTRALTLFLKHGDDAEVLDWGSEMAGAFLAPLPESTVPPVSSSAPVTEISSSSVPHTYAIPLNPQDPLVQKYLSLYTGPLRARFQATLDRMETWRPFITQCLQEEGLPEELLYLPIVESEYQPNAVSRAGATGLWQFMAPTARYAGLKVNYWVDERRDPEKSTRAALRTLKTLYDWFDDWHLALAAYNRGLYGVQRDLQFTRATNFSSLSQRQGLPEETELYVPKWMACVIIGQNLETYGFRRPSPSVRTGPDRVSLEKPLDLKIAAACAGTTEDEIRRLNPSINLWVTPKEPGSFVLNIPSGSQEVFEKRLAEVKDWTPSPGIVRYRVKKGDVLGRIAQKYHTTATALQKENKISHPSRLRPGQVLVIRPGRGFKGED